MAPREEEAGKAVQKVWTFWFRERLSYPYPNIEIPPGLPHSYIRLAPGIAPQILAVCHNRATTRHESFHTVLNSIGERKRKFHALNFYGLQNLPGFDLVSRRPRLEANANNAISVV